MDYLSVKDLGFVGKSGRYIGKYWLEKKRTVAFCKVFNRFQVFG
jgi:hypothetical protein